MSKVLLKPILQKISLILLCCAVFSATTVKAITLATPIKKNGLAKNTQNQTTYTMLIVKTGNACTYQKVTAKLASVAVVAFYGSYYLFPIPQPEINKNRTLIRNPGY